MNEAAGGTPFPVLDKAEGGLPGGVWLALEYTAPGLDAGLLSLPVGGRSPSGATPPALPAAPGGRPATVSGAPSQGDRPGAWVELGRVFGPLHVRRIGASYEAGTVWLMVDGEFTASGISLSVSGLALGADLDAEGFPVRTRLGGLGVEFARPPLLVSGALVNRVPPPEGYELMVGGMLVVQLPQLGLTVVGAYQRRRDGMPSLFVFGRGTMALGGPPPFRVRGLAAGFGFNSSVRVPGAGEVERFPLMSGLDGNLPENPMEMLDRLSGEWVSSEPGQLWLAAGIDFTSFEFITGRLLALLEAGDTLTLALLGTARAAFPRKGRAYAQIKLELRIVHSSARGAFEAGAQLYDSYVIDPNCSLTGGFAYTMWFGDSPHAGDFALTAGGYHPGYEPPGHYPQVPRLGFSWSLGLLGRPLALVRARVRIDLDGPAHYDPAWRNLLDPEPSALTTHRWPVRLGERDDLGDGLLAYVHERDYGTLHTVLDTDDLADLEDPGGYLRPIGTGTGLAVSARPPHEHTSGSTTELTLLMDPYGTVHATTGILPTAALLLPSGAFEEPLAALTAAFRFGPMPVLPSRVEGDARGDAPQLALPVPSGRHGTWTWEQRTADGGWRSHPTRSASTAPDLPAPRPELRTGWLQLHPAAPQEDTR
nr:DUF6603 domain-containing protein [Streptomyces sp. SID5468]